jgi:hypothetical protein
MNDMAFLCEHTISGSGDLQSTDIAALNRSLRRNVNSARSYRPPIQLTIAPRRLAVRKHTQRRPRLRRRDRARERRRQSVYWNRRTAREP